MKQNISLWLVIIIAGLFFTGCKQADNKLTDQEVSDGWVLLFDGKSLDGWRDFKGVPEQLLPLPGKQKREH